MTSTNDNTSNENAWIDEPVLPQPTEVVPAPKPSSSVVDKWLAHVRDAAPGGVESVRSALNKSAFILGMQIPRNKVDEKLATTQLIQAGIAAGLNPSQAESTVKQGIAAGKDKEEKAIQDRQPQNTPTKEDTGTGL